MSAPARAHDWSSDAETLLVALIQTLGPPQGERGRSRKAYRQAARRLAAGGVVPEALDTLLCDYAAETLRATGPMPLAAFLAGRLKVDDRRLLAVQRWASECVLCGQEVGRGELIWLRRDLGDSRWLVSCGECEAIDHSWERAEQARRLALERDDDPDALLTAILAHTPPEQREQVEDDLTLRLEASRG